LVRTDLLRRLGRRLSPGVGVRYQRGRAAIPSSLATPLVGGFEAAGAAVQGLSRTLAGEFGPQGIRVIGLQPDAIQESAALLETLGLHAKAAGLTREEVQTSIERRMLLRRLPTLAEVANVASFMASDRASAMTGTVVNLTCGAIGD
jgi:NAD(P)-dependent dehydrogenase (short-subunit alcohol dehydrogenase family)